MFKELSKNSTPTDIRLRFTIFFGIFGVIIFTIYASINLIAKDYPFAIFEAVLAVMSLALAYLTFKSNSEKWARSFGFIPIVMISLSNFVFGGFENTGIYWTFIIPPIIVYLTGIKRSLIIIGIFFLITVAYYSATVLGIFEIRYTIVEFLTFVFSFLSIYLMSYLFKLSWNMSEKLLENQKGDLQKITDELKIKVDQLELTKLELELSLEEKQKMNDELSKFNKLTVDREVKMVELKKEIDSLKGDSQN